MDLSDCTGPRVLLIGQRITWGWTLLAILEELRCAVRFLTPGEATSETPGLLDFDIILGGPDCGRAVHLSPGLQGSRAWVFYLYPVEDGCWWLPALRQGKDCYGSSALRPGEFATQLRQLLRTPPALSTSPGRD